jgi:hypothetical protein
MIAESFALRHETEKHGKQGVKQHLPTGRAFWRPHFHPAQPSRNISWLNALRSQV